MPNTSHQYGTPSKTLTGCCLAPLGLMASFGQSSGAIGPVDIGILAAKGSLFLTRPTLNTYTASREDLLTAACELFEVVKSGAVKIAVNQTSPLREAARAHRDLRDLTPAP